MEENKEPKSRREKFSERLKTKYPDRQYADDEEMFGQIDDDYEEYESRLSEYKGREQKLNELFSRDPRSAKFITDMAKGEDPLVGFIKSIGVDGITELLNDPEKQEQYAQANKEYVDRLAKEKGLEEDYKKNIASSMETVKAMQQERGLDEEMVDAAIEFVLKMADEAIGGTFTKETIDMALKAINHDADVENASEEGKIAGRNTKINEQLRKSKQGDGVPHMAGKNSPGKVAPKKTMSIFDYADAAS